MSDAKRNYEANVDIARTHTRLNTFGSVVAILEGGCLPSGCISADNTARKIIALCKAEQQRQLKKYDRLSGRDLIVRLQK